MAESLVDARDDARIGIYVIRQTGHSVDLPERAEREGVGRGGHAELRSRAAADSDPEIAALHQQRQQARYEDQRRLARSLSSKGALRPGLSEDHATDIIWTLANPRTHHALVTERHWTTDEYQRWLGHLLAAAHLPEPPT